MKHGHRDLRILWAEDSGSDQYLIRSALAGTQFEACIQFAVDGELALRELARRQPDGIVLDVNMPSMDGITTLRRIRERYGAIPVIMFSTANDADQVRQCRSLGVLTYAIKPVDYDAFCKVVRRILAQLEAQPKNVAQRLATLSR